jgi:hypothetical protein
MKRLSTLTTCALVATIGFAAVGEAAAPAKTTFRGSFVGTAKYTGSGNVSIVKAGTTRTIKIASNFKADRRSVRLRMYLAKSPGGRGGIDLGAMRETGAQSFRVPASANLGTYRYVVAWCAAVNEPIASAKLNLVR